MRMALVLLWSVGVLAQAPGTPPVLPVVDAAHRLEGAALVQALGKGGYNLYIRHAAQYPPEEIEDCSKPALTPVGISSTAEVAAALRALKVPVGRILSSEPCRNRETARRLGFGNAEIAKGLNAGSETGALPPGAARRALLSETPAPGTNAILVSHVHGGKDRADWMHLELLEMIVFLPKAGNAVPVARIRREDWAALLAADAR